MIRHWLFHSFHDVRLLNLEFWGKRTLLALAYQLLDWCDSPPSSLVFHSVLKAERCVSCFFLGFLEAERYVSCFFCFIRLVFKQDKIQHSMNLTIGDAVTAVFGSKLCDRQWGCKEQQLAMQETTSFEETSTHFQGSPTPRSLQTFATHDLFDSVMRLIFWHSFLVLRQKNWVFIFVVVVQAESSVSLEMAPGVVMFSVFWAASAPVHSVDPLHVAVGVWLSVWSTVQSQSSTVCHVSWTSHKASRRNQPSIKSLPSKKASAEGEWTVLPSVCSPPESS